MVRVELSGLGSDLRRDARLLFHESQSNSSKSFRCIASPMQTWERLSILLSQRIGGSSVSMVVSIPSAIDRAILEQYADRQNHDLPCTPVSIRHIHCRSCVTVSVIERRHRFDAEQLAKSSRDRKRRRLPCSLTAFKACSTRCEIETTSLMPT